MVHSPIQPAWTACSPHINGNGGVYLFYTTGSGGTGGNSIVRVTDAAGWNQSMNIISSNVIYKASSQTSIKGLTFTPRQTAHAARAYPAANPHRPKWSLVISPFSVTNTPDNPVWRSAITGVTVDGFTLPTSAYDTTQSGKIVFNPGQSTLLQGSGAKSIVVSATGYGDDAVIQTVAGVPSSILGTVLLSRGALTFAFTNATGLSFSVLATNNIAAPITNWPVVGPAVESPAGSGNYQFTNSPATNDLFYILRQP